MFGRSWAALDMELVYDVTHNIAKLEEHEIGSREKKVWVHRKGATRAFPPGWGASIDRHTRQSNICRTRLAKLARRSKVTAAHQCAMCHRRLGLGAEPASDTS